MPLEERLRTLFYFVHDWLTFSERMSVALLFSNSTAIFAVMGFLKADKLFISPGMLACVYGALFSFSFSLVLCLLPFLPKIIISFLVLLRSKKYDGSFTFYAGRENRNLQEYVQPLFSAMNKDLNEIDRIGKHYIQRALKDDKYFILAMSLALFAVIMVFIGGLLSIL